MIRIELMEQLVQRIANQSAFLHSEEATKHALVLPFLQSMGYDPFNPEEIIPEYTADFGTKQGEKVDYAIMRDGSPVILIECKKVGDPLDAQRASQLGRYFHLTEARIAILTDGVRYLFFSDLEQDNLMDQTPFLQVDLSSLESGIHRNLRHFAKDTFDVEEACEAAANLKYIHGMQDFLEAAYVDPPDEFVRMMARNVYKGPITPQRREKFAHLTKVAFQGFVNDRVSNTLKKASDIASHLAEEDLDIDDDGQHQESPPNEEKGIITTAEEIEAYEIVKALVSDVVDPERVHIRDSKRYCAVLMDDTRLQQICRLHLHSSTTKYITIMTGERDERGRQASVRYDIDQINDIVSYQNERFRLLVRDRLL